MKRMHRISGLPEFFLLLIAALVFSPTGFALAAEKPVRGDSVLLETYSKIEHDLEKNSFGFPLSLESSDENGRLHVDVYGIFDHPFSSVVDVLRVPANWCEIAFLHPNVKTCTYRELPGSWRLTFYISRKVSYQPPADTSPFVYEYRNVEQRQEYVDVVLTAPEGPFGTKDHKMRFEAIPIDRGRTFVHVSYAYSHGFSVRLAEKVYFATLGSGRAGFTVSGTDSSGKPVYIAGARGAIERNVVRYYLAIQSFMDTLRQPEESRFTTRISQWHDLSSRFRRQLFDLDKKDYLTFKTDEHKNQVILQRGVSASHE
jgi:hypothetical protein